MTGRAAQLAAQVREAIIDWSRDTREWKVNVGDVEAALTALVALAERAENLDDNLARVQKHLQHAVYERDDLQRECGALARRMAAAEARVAELEQERGERFVWRPQDGPLVRSNTNDPAYEPPYRTQDEWRRELSVVVARVAELEAALEAQREQIEELERLLGLWPANAPMAVEVREALDEIFARAALAAPSVTANTEERTDDLSVLGHCPHGVDLDREFCPEGCRV